MTLRELSSIREVSKRVTAVCRRARDSSMKEGA